MVEAADGPDEPDETGCGRAVESPAVGSDLPMGTNMALPFFRVVYPAASAPLALADDAVMVEPDEAEFREALEFERWAVLRGCCCGGFCMFKARVNSSCESPFKLLLFHAVLLGAWNVRGGATAVIGKRDRCWLWLL